MKRLFLLLITLITSVGVYGQLPKGSVALGHGIYFNKNKPDCEVTNIHDRNNRTSGSCECTQQDATDNGYTIGFGPGHFGRIYMYEDLSLPNNYAAYEGDGISVWYDFGFGPVRVLDMGWDPLATPGYSYVHLFNPNGIPTISEDGPTATTTIRNVASPYSTTISSGALTANQANWYPDESGPFAINPIKADTSIVGMSDSGLIYNYPVPAGSPRTYSIGGYLTIMHITAYTLSYVLEWIDDGGNPRTYIFNSSSIAGDIPILTRNIRALGGTSIMIHTTLTTLSPGVLNYNVGCTIEKKQKN